jgi:hypothetical protein
MNKKDLVKFAVAACLCMSAQVAREKNPAIAVTTNQQTDAEVVVKVERKARKGMNSARRIVKGEKPQPLKSAAKRAIESECAFQAGEL